LQDASTFTFSGGTVTANAFSGDGSALTGITAAGTGAIGGITVKDEGVVVGTAGSVSSFDFKGSYITAIATAGAAGVATVTLSETPSFTTLNVTGVSTFAGITTATDILFTKNFSVSGVSTFNNAVNLAGVTIAGSSLFTGSVLTFNDNKNLQFGTGVDTEIFFNGTDQIINSKAGIIKIQTNDGEDAIHVNPNSSVDLYFNNVKKLATTTHGVVVTGILTATDVDSTSDIRLKTNIQAIENPLAKVIQIEGVSFNWKEDNRPALGVIADQVQEILPELVHGNDPKTVNYNGLIGLLIEAVKEQQIQIDELRSKLP